MNSLKAEFEKAVNEMTVEDMPTEDMRNVAEDCGLDVAIILLKKMCNVNIYIPGQKRYKKVIEKFVIKNFNSTNAKLLAQACNISLAHVYEIIQREDERRNTQKVKQLSFIDD